jgi:hypothetical protein
LIRKVGKTGLWGAKLGPGNHLKGMTIMGIKGKDFDIFHEVRHAAELIRAKYCVPTL